jgi:hypothetical protein
LDEPQPLMHLTAPSTPVPASYFGIHIHRPSAGSWPQIPAAEWRLWDSEGSVWYNLEPHRGQWNFAQLDRDVAMAEEHHVGLLLTLGQSPPWASSRPKDPPTWRPGGPAPPADEQDWKSYVHTVAVRYQGRIHTYEVWNEPNLKEFYSGTPEQLVALARDAYEIIHQIDPTAVVVSPSITGSYGIGWLRHYLDAGGGQYADVIGYHFYASPKAPEASIATMLQVREVMCNHHLENTSLWDTETGFSIESKFKVIHPLAGSLSQIVSQADAIGYVMRAYVVHWAAGVSRLYWYDWDGNAMGLGDNDGHEKKAAASGYIAIHQWMVGAIIKSCDRDSDGNWTCALSRDGHPQWIIWNDEGTTDTKPTPVSWKVKSVSTVGPTGGIVTEGLRARRISFTSTPELLR